MDHLLRSGATEHFLVQMDSDFEVAEPICSVFAKEKKLGLSVFLNSWPGYVSTFVVGCAIKEKPDYLGIFSESGNLALGPKVSLLMLDEGFNLDPASQLYIADNAWPHIVCKDYTAGK